MQILVSTLTNKTITLNVNITNTIGEIKDIIQEKEKINSEYQVLYYQTKLLDDNDTLESKNITRNSTLYLLISFN